MNPKQLHKEKIDHPLAKAIMGNVGLSLATPDKEVDNVINKTLTGRSGRRRTTATTPTPAPVDENRARTVYFDRNRTCTATHEIKVSRRWTYRNSFDCIRLSRGQVTTLRSVDLSKEMLDEIIDAYISNIIRRTNDMDYFEYSGEGINRDYFRVDSQRCTIEATEPEGLREAVRNTICREFNINYDDLT